MSELRVGYLQFDPKFGEREQNIEKALSLIESSDFDLVVLPELFNTGYQFISKKEAFSLSETVPHGYSSQRIIDFCKRTRRYVVAGIAESNKGKIFNSAILSGPNGFIGCYRKIHLFYEENLWFEPGDLGFKVWKTPIGTIGIMICFDWFFPESARTLALMGADIIAHPANLVLHYCPDAMVTRCIENRLFAITANRIGVEKRGHEELKFIGTSEIVSPRGEVLVRANSLDEVASFATINTQEGRNKKLNRFNDILGDRRREFYL